MAKILKFPIRAKRKPINFRDVIGIEFINEDGRSLWVKNEDDILKIMRFLTKEKITIFEDPDGIL